MGTKVTLKLPISMAIIQALMVGLNKKIYAIPLSNVVTTLNIKEEDMKTIKGTKVTVMQGKVLPLLSLADLLEEPYNNGSNTNVVVVEKNEQHTGLIVDSLIDQHEIVIKSFDTTLKQLEGFSGATILDDGNVVLIMDIDNLLTMGGY
jgi:two-component system chemotaxis sensor kinase CheA